MTVDIELTVQQPQAVGSLILLAIAYLMIRALTPRSERADSTRGGRARRGVRTNQAAAITTENSCAAFNSARHRHRGRS